MSLIQSFNSLLNFSIINPIPVMPHQIMSFFNDLSQEKRRLTSGEIELGRSIFGDSIDYDVVRIQLKPSLAGQETLAYVANLSSNTIKVSPSTYSRDMSHVIDSAVLLAHELTHVHDFQNATIPIIGPGLQGRGEQLSDFLSGQNPYFLELNPAETFNSLSSERRATAVERLVEGDGAYQSSCKDYKSFIRTELPVSSSFCSPPGLLALK